MSHICRLTLGSRAFVATFSRTTQPKVESIGNYYHINCLKTKNHSKTSNVRFLNNRSRRVIVLATDDREQIVSPFEEEKKNDGKVYDELTPENVESVLDRVRPYLMADGGNVEVMQVVPEAGIISLQLQGACGSCPSSQQTLKLGIEKELFDAFGGLLKSVQEVKPGRPPVTVEMVDKFLDQLRPAIENYGGWMEVTGVEDGVCNINYKGPAMIATGIRDAVKEGFKNDFETVVVLIVEEDEDTE
mmetsp:Transcript_5262/g.7131  ORF Transcript_5262/g.7131 Transcript_5262/m.7131 type:complete len:245 (+) Transcript_5262:117-851(+)